MRKILFFMLSIWAVQIYAQNGKYTGSRLKSGKSASKSGAFSPDAIGKKIPISGQVFDLPVTTNKTETQANEFHDTKGNIEVNNGGQLQFTLPIALPPGVKSVAPQVNLLYASGSGNGVAGYGWNIGGITAVSRVNKNIEKNNEIIGIQSDYTDLYSFNGQRLILKSGEYGKDGAEYVTEKYSNLKIKSYGAIVGKPWSGPLYWEVNFEDGSQAWFGNIPNNSAATTDLQYNIIKWKDINGNYISYEYDQTELNSSNITLIKSIKWGGNEVLGKPHFNSIEFNYIDRAQKETAYHQGILHTQKKILKDVTVMANLVQFKKYVINYVDNGTSYEFVDKITEYNAANEASNPVTFGYASNSTGSEETSSQYNVNNFNTKKYADFNMDGIADYIEFVSAGVINYRSSVYLGVNAISLQYDASKFTANDFKNAIPVTFKKDNYVKNRVGLVIPVPKATSVSYKKDYEFQVYSIDIPNQQLVFEYSKTIDYDSFAPFLDEEGFGCNNPSVPAISEALSYDYNGDGVSELVLKFRISQLCNNGGGNPLDPGMITRTVNEDTPADETPGTMGEGAEPHIDDTNTEYGDIPVDIPPDNIGPGQTLKSYVSYLLVDLDQNLGMPQSVYQFTATVGTGNNPIKFADLNGDGIQEIIIQTNSQFTSVFNIKRDLAYNYSKVDVGNFAGQNFVGTVYTAMLFGDFNGDSKTDILVPQANKSYNWDLYISDGKKFNKFYLNNFILYQSGTETLSSGVHNTFYESGCTYGMLRMFQYQTSDLDGDGKTEILVSNVLLYDHEWNAHRDQEWTNVSVAVYSVNKLTGSSNKSIIYNPTYSPFPGVNVPMAINTENTVPIDTNSGISFFRAKYWLKGYNEKVIPFSTLSLNRENQQIILTGKPVDCQGAECDYNYVLHYNYTFLPTIARVTQIKQGEVVTNISYKELNSTTDPNFYKPVKTEPYPYIELEKVPQSSVVSQLAQFSPTSVLYQDFRYRGMLSHFHGRGVVGFRQFAKSTWFTPGLEAAKLWMGAEVDPLNESVPIKEWTIRTNDEAKIFPANLSETNTELLAFKSTSYSTDKILNGQVVTSIAPDDKAKIVTSSVVNQSRTKDFLTNTVTVNTTEYGSYYLPARTISNINNGYSIKTAEFDYYNNPGGVNADYYIGRIKTKNNIVQAYNDTKSGKEEFTYENNLIKTAKNWNRDNSGYLQENYEYDGFGNITAKIVSNSVDAQVQTTQSAYDDKGRFIIKTTDNLGLETNMIYNDWGQITKQTDPLGNTISNVYDNWGKILTMTSSLSGVTTYTYDKLSLGLGIRVKETAPDGNEKMTYTNAIGQNYKSTTKAFGQGKYVTKDIGYDALGRKIFETQPYFEGQSPTQINTMTYDDNFFPAKVTAVSFNGKESLTSVSGFTTTVKEVNGYGRTVSKTTDAIGNVVSSTDKGGTVQFKYNAADEQIAAAYDTNKVVTKYDVWGRRSEFTDPSNGTYKYEYNGFGQILKITSPKGTKQYVYNTLGQLVTQTELSSDGGTSTNKTIAFEYDTKGRLISRSGSANGKNYSVVTTYDPQGRISSTTENSNGKRFAKNIFYNDRSKVKSYVKTITSSGVVVVEANIINEYNVWNGELYRLKDKRSGRILWELQDTNAAGQAILSKLGEVTVTNMYDANGFLSSTNHSSPTQPGILQVGYTFDAIRNELKTRTTGGDFNITETFSYDDNNRLISWTNPKTGQNSTNVYDVKGRIMENDQIGTINYEDGSKIYQATSANLNAAGVQNYNNDLIQYINYNENNDPTYINGIKGDVAFQYGLTSMRQVVNYGGNFNPNQEGKYKKIYSEDGSFEVIRNNNDNKKEKYIIYIGGTPYESNIVFIKGYNDTAGTYKFLHKDYLGSILAISDEEGKRLEQRHFDAWGNLTHLKVGNGAVITDKNSINEYIQKGLMVVERGYTSHEHFSEVGLIHMNGRLYDPLLRRFLNADENIQDPYNTQNYNKYGYVFNNPLLFSDPSGEYIFGITEAFVAAIVIGAMVGTASYIINTIITGQKFTLLGYFKAEFFGALSGAVTYGIGSIFTTTAGAATQFAASIGKVGSAFLQATAHGIAQGTLSLMQGGTHQSGMISGFLGSMGATIFKEVAGSFAKSAEGMVLSGAVMGGVGAELTGGNFWQGALVGGVVAGLNHYFHSLGKKSTIRSYLESADIDPDRGATSQDPELLVTKVPEFKKLNINGGVTIVEEWTRRSVYGSYEGGKVMLNCNADFNKTVLDYAITLFHELNHHFFLTSGIYDKMLNQMLDGKRINWNIINDKYGFNEYQAAFATKNVAEGARFWNEVALNGIQECFLMDNGFSTRSLMRLYNEYVNAYWAGKK
ncbi:RHS repeat-associated core domain-containing protein [Chryseobacterium sp. NRRL B-14859]|uniref:RHS repeat-associated core domain-containing protein n=1 Tax=Chryseobacterium sp. NRRL B-14859 TaxID=1562763 RepID=UPI00339B5836